MKLKKIFLGIGTLFTIATPISLVVACHTKSETKKIVSKKNDLFVKDPELLIDLTSTTIENKQEKAIEFLEILTRLKDEPKKLSIIYYFKGTETKVTFTKDDFIKFDDIANDDDFLKEFSVEHLTAFNEVEKFVKQNIPNHEV